MTVNNKGLLDQAKKFVSQLQNNKGKANDIIDNLGVKESDKTAMKDLLGKSSNGLDSKDQTQVMNLIKSLINQGGNDPAKKKKAADTIKKLKLADKLNPSNRKMLEQIMKMLEK